MRKSSLSKKQLYYDENDEIREIDIEATETDQEADVETDETLEPKLGTAVEWR